MIPIGKATKRDDRHQQCCPDDALGDTGVCRVARQVRRQEVDPALGEDRKRLVELRADQDGEDRQREEQCQEEEAGEQQAAHVDALAADGAPAGVDRDRWGRHRQA
jgi:hypothetical protein